MSPDYISILPTELDSARKQYGADTFIAFVTYGNDIELGTEQVLHFEKSNPGEQLPAFCRRVRSRPDVDSQSEKNIFILPPNNKKNLAQKLSTIKD